jgi:hypothetical protein
VNSIGITALQSKPALLKTMLFSEIIDKREKRTLGYYISSKYEKYVKELIEKIERDEKIRKLHILKKHQDLEFSEIGVDDGVE